VNRANAPTIAMRAYGLRIWHLASVQDDNGDR
jgi:hypothetical protein